jgi:DnaK suppressor protein
MEFVDSNEITKEEKAYYKEKLIGMLQALQEESGVTVQDMKENSQDFPDPADRANFEFERNTTLRIRDRERKLAKKIRKTLKRLEDEEYNVCDECGDYIRKKRLDARPVTSLCIHCKELEEQKERTQFG